MEIIPMGAVDEVLGKALASPLVPIEWVDPEQIPEGKKDASQESVVTH